jgi:hypothetical protein
MDPKGYAFGGVEGRRPRLASFTRLPCRHDETWQATPVAVPLFHWRWSETGK